jgi:hypothetical protein
VTIPPHLVNLIDLVMRAATNILPQPEVDLSGDWLAKPKSPKIARNLQDFDSYPRSRNCAHLFGAAKLADQVSSVDPYDRCMT